MRLHLWTFVCGLLIVPTVVADVEFHAVRTKNEKSHVKLEFDKPQKYFHEATFHKHYDGRFGERELTSDELRTRLSYLVQTYLRTMNDLGVETWLMHGSLLNWWWNHKIMPWDANMSMMVSERSLHHLVSFYNMTMHRHHLPNLWSPREYLLEISPHCKDGTTDQENAVDARFIDTDVGLYINIVTLRADKVTGSADKNGAMFTKDGLKYKHGDIFPLYETTFEGMPAQVPHTFTELLGEEYGTKALSRVSFDGNEYTMKEEEWISNRHVRPVDRAS